MFYEHKSLEYILGVPEKLNIDKLLFKKPHNSIIIRSLSRYSFLLLNSKSQWQWKIGVMKELRLMRFSLF